MTATTGSGAGTALAGAKLAGLLLAAGGATRFGAPKVLAPFLGEPLVLRAARLLRPLCPAGVQVVIGAESERVRAALGATGVQLVSNPGWQSGLASSIRSGIAALPPEAEAVLLMLCDTPAITAADLGGLVAAWAAQPSRIVAAAFAGRVGPPVILPRSAWAELSALHGDQGARSLLEWHPDVLPVPMPSAALDVDTPADLARLEAAAAPEPATAP